jgi:hypothetical protein
MASTYGSLRQRLAVRSDSAQLRVHSAWLKAATPLGHNLLGGCAAATLSFSPRSSVTQHTPDCPGGGYRAACRT